MFGVNLVNVASVAGRRVACREKLRGPFGAEKLSLLKDELSSFVLQIGWVAVLPQNSFYQDLDFGAGTLAERPVDGDAFAYSGNKFCRDHFEVILAHDL